MRPASKYVFALRFRWLTGVYDMLLRHVLDERRFKSQLVRELSLEPGHRVLDLGCGTGTLTIMVKQAHPEAMVVGLDGDDQILERARRKASAAGVSVLFIQGLAHAQQFALPGYFDAVVSSLMFHHLTTEHKRYALQASRSALRPGGTLLVADWGSPHDLVMRLAFLGVQLLDGFETTRDNVQGAIPALMKSEGFTHVREVHRQRTVLGSLSFYRAEAP